MPCTPWRRTSSATRNASTIAVKALDHLEQVIVRDHEQRVDLRAQLRDAALGLLARREPSKPNGLVTTPTVSASSSRASSAITGAAPVPVPPPSPAVTKTMSAPFSASFSWSRVSIAASRPTSGFAPRRGRA